MANTRGKRKEMIPVYEVMENNEMVTELIQPSNKEGIVECQNLNVRKAPSLGATILQIISNGTKVEILDETNELWYKVRVGAIESGFCMKEFINIVE